MAAIAINQAATSAATRSATHALTRAVAAALLVAAAAIVAVLLLAVRPDWWRAFAAASVVSVAAAAASVPVVAWGLRTGLKRPEILTFSYVASMFIRAVVGIGGGVAAVILGRYPLTATLMMILPYYFSILAAETIVVARLLRTAPLQQPEPPASRPAENTHA
jgi:hypothetical protein